MLSVYLHLVLGLSIGEQTQNGTIYSYIIPDYKRLHSGLESNKANKTLCLIIYCRSGSKL